MRVDGGEPWLWHVDCKGKPRRVKGSFTDRTEPDEFSAPSRPVTGFFIFRIM
jgi:hypothetical protein